MEENHQPEEETQKQEPPVEFKKPVLIGRVGKLPKKAKSELEKVSKTEPSGVGKSTEEPSNTDAPVANSSLPPAVLLKELSTPIPYKEPKWSGLCPDGSDYALEVLKSGMIVERVDLNKKPYYVFGRLANCDVVMAHPTISRHHAVLQYKAFAAEGEPPSGWYIYDLGSTHGTFLNKEQLKLAHYTRVRVGHQIKFGSSTRTYIVLGPDFDCEGESDLTVTEIKQKAQVMKLERDRLIKEATEQKERERLEQEKRREEQGIDWGMGEDAEEEPDLSENPYAATNNEELYLEDPKKTLRGYMEREGHELQYHCDERGPGQFLCRVELPLDDSHGRPVVAEVMHRGKKKEAVIACALEACRLLDRAGLLRQATHEPRARRTRDWSADDYYDSDEDSFLDRTGTVERKRRARMDKHSDRKQEDKPLTYDDLLKKISEIEARITLEEKNLEGLRASGRQPAPSAAEDELDAFMSSLKQQGHSMSQKAEISRTKMTIQKLKGELTKTRRLADIARPADLPPLQPADVSKMAVRQTNSVVYGKRIRLKEDSERHKKVRKESKQEETEFVEEMDSDEEEQPQNTNTPQEKTQHDEVVQTTKTVQSKEKSPNVLKMDIVQNDKIKSEESEKPARVFGPMRPPDNYVIPDNYFDQESDRDLPNIEENENV